MPSATVSSVGAEPPRQAADRHRDRGQRRPRPRRPRRQRPARRGPARSRRSSAATTNAPCRTTTSAAEPGRDGRWPRARARRCRARRPAPPRPGRPPSRPGPGSGSSAAPARAGPARPGSRRATTARRGRPSRPVAQVEAVGDRRRQPADVEQQRLGRAALDRGDPPRRQQRGHQRQGGRGRTPDRAVADGAADDQEGGGDHDQAEQRGEQPQRPGRTPPPGRAAARCATRPASAGRRPGRRSRARRGPARAAAPRRRPRRTGRRSRRRSRPGPAPRWSRPRAARRAARPSASPGGRRPAGTARRPTARTARRARSTTETAAARAAAEQGREQRQRQRRTAAPGTAVPVPSGCQVSTCSRHQSPAPAGDRRQAAAGQRAEGRRGRRPARPRRTAASASATGLVRNRATSPVSSTSSSSSERRPGDRARGRALRGRGPAPLGDVLRLVGGRGRQVADEVEAVPVGHPPRGQQACARPAGRAAGARRARRGGADLAGRGVERHQRGELVERLADASGPAGSRPSAAGCRRPAGRPATAAPGPRALASSV